MSGHENSFWNHFWMVLFVFPLVLAAVAAPLWPWSRQWGKVPAAGLLLLALLVLLAHVQYIL
jgi:hypothetical protein